MSKNANTIQPDDNGITLKNAKSIHPKARDMKMEYHSLNEEERQWTRKWVLNLHKVLTFVISVFVLIIDIVAFVCWHLNISNFDTYATEYFLIFSISSVIIWGISFILLPIRNKGILKRIDFDNVQECILHLIVRTGAGKTRGKYYVIWQWDAEKQKFYEVKYLFDLPKCYSGDIVYHPYGMKFYIPGIRK